MLLGLGLAKAGAAAISEPSAAAAAVSPGSFSLPPLSPRLSYSAAMGWPDVTTVNYKRPDYC